MKTKDIEVGAEYAYAQGFEWNRKGLRVAHRVTVLGTGEKRRVWSNWGSHQATDGIRVRFESDRRAGEEIVVIPEVRMPWTVFEEADREIRAHLEAAEQITADRTAALAARARAVVGSDADGLVLSRGTVTIRTERLIELLELAAAGGAR